MISIRFLLFALFIGIASLYAKADDVLFIGNSFTFGESAPAVKANGGVPKLFEAIALAKGKSVSTFAVTAGGRDWGYHLAQPATAEALALKSWTWVVLQDYSTAPTKAGNFDQFMKDGETFSDRIAKSCPAAGILLYETWARPPGAFYQVGPGKVFTGPEQMIDQLHFAYVHLENDLAEKNPNRPVRVALVGTAFAKSEAEFPAIELNAADHHHATADGYYLAALVMYETIYHDTAKGAPSQFYKGELIIPTADAAKLQQVADEVTSAATTPTAAK